MQSRATQIAATYQVHKEDWVQAATDLRQPYWDWAVNAVPPDEVIALKKVTITLPNGRRGSVDNPLYHYTFHPIDSTFPEPFSKWRTTLRQPTGTSAGATDNVARLKKLVIVLSSMSMTYRILGYFKMRSRILLLAYTTC